MTYWFEPHKSGGLLPKPVKWQGWAMQIAAIFIFIILTQMAGRWAYFDFQPLALGVWLVAGLFLLFGGYLSLARKVTRPETQDRNRSDNAED